jgi:hypothetical protein
MLPLRELSSTMAYYRASSSSSSSSSSVSSWSRFSALGADPTGTELWFLGEDDDAHK